MIETIEQEERKTQKGPNSTTLRLDDVWIVPKEEEVCCTTLPVPDRGEEEHR